VKVRQLVPTLSPQAAMRMCSVLKTSKAMELWKDEEITVFAEAWNEPNSDFPTPYPQPTVKPGKVRIKKEKECTDSAEEPTSPTVTTATTAPEPKEPKVSKSKEKKTKDKSPEPPIVKLNVDPVQITADAVKNAEAAVAAITSDVQKNTERIASIKVDLAAAEEKAKKDQAVLKKVVAQLEQARSEAAAAVVAAAKKKADELADISMEKEGSETSDPLHVRRKNIPKHVKTLVWNKYVGSTVAEASCMCCREAKITCRSFHCGHVIAESKGGNMTINNLRPVCADCNLSMGTRSMNEFTQEFFGWFI
jgi:hypothetical protein